MSFAGAIFLEPLRPAGIADALASIVAPASSRRK
jgi:hypothetical protein